MVRVGLVAPAMPRILAAVNQQVAVQLLDVVLGWRNRVERREDCFHDFGVSRHFLLVAGGKVPHFNVRKQPLDITV